MLSYHPEPIFATASYLIFDIEKYHFICANAGRPVPIRVNNVKGECGELEIDPAIVGPPLGLLDSMDYGVFEGPIEEGDFLLTYTDGLAEVFNSDNALFGTDRLIEAVRALCDRPPMDLLNGLISEVRDFSQSERFEDDVCIVGAQIA